MCNPDCINWCAGNLSRAEVAGERVLEVGSLNVNGSLRQTIELLGPLDYIGLDVVKGPGVDVVCRAEDLLERFWEESFGVVVSTCLLEHVRDWKKVVSNIKRVCKPNGLILLVVPSNWPFHAYPSDFWRYGRQDIESIFSDCSILALEEDSKRPSLVYAKIGKPGKFVENHLSDYMLHSVVTNKRERDLSDGQLQSLGFRLLVFRSRIKRLASGIARFFFPRR